MAASILSAKNTDVTEPVMYSRIANIDPRTHNGGRTSNM